MREGDFMETTINMVKKELKSWNKLEWIWMIIANTIILGISIYFNNKSCKIL